LLEGLMKLQEKISSESSFRAQKRVFAGNVEPVIA
jgi:hypothetical protein